MSYLGGVGLLEDPYRIHNATALKYWFDNNRANANYAVLVNDIDMYGITVTIPAESSIYANLDGYGFTIFNLTISSAMNTYLKTTWKRLRFKNITANSAFLYGYNNSTSFLQDVIFDGVDMPTHTSYIAFTRVIFMNLVRALASNYTPTNGFLIDSTYAISKFTDLRSVADKYNQTNYSGLNTLLELWLFDGSSAPRLIPQNVTGLIQAYIVKGITKVGGQLKSRRCRAVAPIDFNEIANIVSGVDGSYQLNCGYYSDHVYVIHSDDYGRKLTTSKAYGLDDYIHPITPNGYRYKCTTAGTSDTTLPTEPWSTTVNLISGTAIFTPEPIYKAETLLVVPVLCDLLTGLPVS